MNIIEWKERYIKRLIDWGLNKKEAKENYYAGYDGYNSDNPESAADDEISYYKEESLYK